METQFWIPIIYTKAGHCSQHRNPSDVETFPLFQTLTLSLQYDIDNFKNNNNPLHLHGISNSFFFFNFPGKTLSFPSLGPVFVFLFAFVLFFIFIFCSIKTRNKSKSAPLQSYFSANTVSHTLFWVSRACHVHSVHLSSEFLLHMWKGGKGLVFGAQQSLFWIHHLPTLWFNKCLRTVSACFGGNNS